MENQKEGIKHIKPVKGHAADIIKLEKGYIVNLKREPGMYVSEDGTEVRYHGKAHKLAVATLEEAIDYAESWMRNGELSIFPSEDELILKTQ